MLTACMHLERETISFQVTHHGFERPWNAGSSSSSLIAIIIFFIGKETRMLDRCRGGRRAYGEHEGSLRH